MKKLRASSAGVGACLLLFIIAFAWRCEASRVSNDECIECHGREDIQSSRGKNRFIDVSRFALSAHGKKKIGCVSCHDGIVSISRLSQIPHQRGIEPKCRECHERVSNEYENSLHYQVSKKICYSCHNPHYSVSFRDMSGDQRKNICLKCHDTARTHRWLPQKELHFNYLECTSCHSLNAQIGMLIFMVDKGEASTDNVLNYKQLVPFIEHGKDLVETLDKDGNGRLSDTELYSFMKKVQENGISGATLDLRILVLRPNHDYSKKVEHTQDCTLCHSKGARFYSKILLEIPESDGGFRTLPVDKDFLLYRGQRPFIGDFYLLGESKIRKEDLDDVLEVIKRIGFKWLDLIGGCLILFTLASVCFHAMLMFLTRKLRRRSQGVEQREPLPVPIEVWHWLHGLGMVLLVMTGIQLRLPDSVPIFANFLNAVNLHNLTGTVLICDYFFWFSYHAWKKEFKSRFFILPADFFKDIAQMLHYYGYLIFIGESFPKSCRHYSAFDPIERVFFLTTMLVIVPIQIVTGVLLLNMHSMMPVIRAIGGLRVVDAIHLVFAYVFTSSMLVHVYFHTLKKYRSSRKRLASPES